MRDAPSCPLRALLLLLLLLGACQSGPQSKPETATAAAVPDSAAFTVRHPAWAAHATIYQVNVRQYTPQGTFQAAEADLPRLQKMGVGILWLMPINPIGRSHRKGTLGSAYSVREYDNTHILPAIAYFAKTGNVIGHLPLISCPFTSYV